MSCEYCKNKRKNKPLVESKDKDEGVMAWVQKRDDGAYLCVYGWFDGWDGGAVGIEPQQAKIKYCPMCGAKLSKVVEEADAVKAWNARKEPITIMSPITTVSEGEPQTYVPLRTCHVETRVIDGIEEDFCTACGNEVACYYRPHYCPDCGAKVVEE